MTINEINKELEKRNALFTLRGLHVLGLKRDYDGFSIVPRDREADSIACPTFRIDPIERATEENVDDLIDELTELYDHYVDSMQLVNFPLDTESFLKAVRPSIFSIDALDDFNTGGVYAESFSCFALSYFIDFDALASEKAAAIWRVTNEYMEKFGIDPETLRDRAFSNLSETFRFVDIGAALGELGVMEDTAPQEGAAWPMYVLSVETRFEGAAAIFCPEARRVAEKTLGGTFYVLPSSRHEVLCVPCWVGKPEELAELVKAINDDPFAMPPADVLSDRVYLYHCGEITVAA